MSYFVKPETVCIATDQGVEEYWVHGVKSYVHTCLGYTHVYKDLCEETDSHCHNQTVTTDTTAFWYRKALVENVTKFYEPYPKATCNLTQLT